MPSRSQPNNTRWVTFRLLIATFISVAFSPPAAHNLACLAATVCVTGLRWHKPTLIKALKSLLKHLVWNLEFSSFCYLPSGPLCHAQPLHCASIASEAALLSAPAGGARSHVQSYLLPVAYDGTLCPHATAAVTPGGTHASFSRRRFYLKPIAHPFLYKSNNLISSIL